ncbi:MAG TPA: von Willebrand factor type A domain-containing protein [Candidatus Edwardsbacteria bacterium]|nr:von Willebrand factor type A domain-containing protein [Candidatus Edwardsbacteria bacterium]
MKKHTILIWAAVALAVLAGILLATEHGSISGAVTDASSRQPLAAASLKLMGTSFLVKTDAAGGFYFANVPAGTYTVLATYPGYETAVLKDVKVEPGKETRISAALKPAVLSIDDKGQVKDELRACEQAPMACCKAACPASVACGGVYRGVPANFTTEEYSQITENAFKDPRHDPLSTFSIDVDPASYANVRRFLTEGTLPLKDAVRIEELVNYFHYDYPQPDDGRPFAINTEVAGCPWNQDHRLVRIGLKGREVPADKLPPANLVFLIDVSGSMQDEDKLPLLKSAFKLLVQQLRPQDRVAIAVYASAEGLVLPSTKGSDKKAILDVLDHLEAGGCTAGAAGIRLAYRTALDNFIKGGNNRVILATDGDFNVGVSSTSELLNMIEQQREHGVFLSVLGFGTGNLKDSRMEQLADKGNGNYAYIDNLSEARKVLVSQMGGTLFTIAKDVKIQVEFNPAKVHSYKLIGYENRLLNKEDFNDDTKDAGELGSGHTVTALYEVVPAGCGEDLPSVDPLKYQRSETSGDAASGELLTVKLRYKDPDGDRSKLIARTVSDGGRAFAGASDDFRFAAAVAEWGLLLRNSAFKGTASYGQVISLARAAKGQDGEGYRAEFVKLAEAARDLAGLARAE